MIAELTIAEHQKKYKKYFDAGKRLGNVFGYFGPISIEDSIKWRLLFSQNIEMTFTPGANEGEFGVYHFYCFMNERSIDISEEKVRNIIYKIEKVGEKAPAKGWNFYKAERGREYKMLLWKYGGNKIEEFVLETARKLN